MTDITDATFLAKLKTDLALTNGSGSATFTRTTTKNVFDNEGKLINVKSGAVAIGGARCVRNLFTASATLATQGVAVTAKTYTVSFYGTGTIVFTGAYAGADLVGTGISDRVHRTFTATAGTVTCTVSGSCTNAQLEDVTGQADQTASEYVDSATDYGAGTTGIKYFNTNKDGSAIESSAQNGVLIDPASKTNTMISCRRLTASNVASTCPWESSVTDVVEKVTNGTFTENVTGWTIGPGAGATMQWNAAGYLDCYCGTTANTFARQIVSGLTAGETYTVGFDRVASSGSVGIYVLDGALLMQSGFSSTDARRSLTFTAASTSITLSLVATTSGITVSIDNVTLKRADIQVSNTGTGITDQTNSCSVLECMSVNATILQTITAGAAAGCTGFWIKRSVGTGAIYITRDGGTTWVDVTSQLNSSTFTCVKIENTSVINPVVGIKMATVGDKIIVDAGLNHLGTQLCEPIFTETASVTRTAESLTYQTASNFSDTAGTILATFTPLHSNAWPSGAIVGKAGSGLLVSPSNTGVQAADGTNTVSGATGAPANSSIRLGCRWSGSSLAAFSADPLLNAGAAGSYDGSFDLSTIAINPDAAGYIKDAAIFNTSLSDADVKDAWKLLDAQTFLPAFSNLPIYNAGAIIHVTPDPPPVDPEPTPIFATEFTGLTVTGPQDFFKYNGVDNTACIYKFTGTDTETSFGPPTAAPVYANSGSGTWGVGYGVHVNSAQNGVAYPFPTADSAGVNTRHTTDIVATTVRGEATNALRLKWLAPGARSNYTQQSWFMLWRSYSTALDFTELTIRFEMKLPDLSTVLSYPPVSSAGSGRLTFFDYKTNSASQGGDFRIGAELVRSSASVYTWEFSCDNIANGYGPALTPTTFWRLSSTEPIPQGENFTVEISIKRAYAAVRTDAYNVISGANAGKARLRIRRESDSVTTWRTIATASESGIAAYNAANGTSWVNRHMGIRGFAYNRLMHGNYGRKENVDCAVEIAKFRMFDAYDV